MGRHREAFTLYGRESKRGKKIWYYRTYSPDGKRTSGKSTHNQSKTLARTFCNGLLKKRILWQGSSKTFYDFAHDFFDEDSIWLKDRLLCSDTEHPSLSTSYIRLLRLHLNRYILPFFADYRLYELKPSVTKLFRIELLETGIGPKGEQIKPLAPKTINNIVGTLKIITDSFLADELITIDPIKTIRPLKRRENPRDAFEVHEIKNILNGLDGNPAFLPTLICATTGMRIGEVLAIRDETIKENYLDVKDQFYRGQFQPIKTKEARKIPLCEELYALVHKGCSFVTYENTSYYFNKGIKKAGLLEEKKKRGLCIHSLRHFFNTYLLSMNISPHKVKAILGHSSGLGSMHERYTSWKPEMFPEVYEAQRKLLKLLL